ncbi:nutritionally-regulated adipose and cardiac enriched protein homolog isoform X2 [Carettochelys insculpta]|uniref:nutritionally-regulated adipose and cardiac enriched protein homolog isoform X2 n=1 Tax=Carettochelys insculpta TaxID=44489 RepID=UPI003EBD0CC0
MLKSEGTDTVKSLLESAESGLPDSFRRPAAVSPLQHEEKSSISPMYRQEKTNCSKCPPSILRKRTRVKQAVGEKRKAERRVRFHEPEITGYAHDRPAAGLPLLLWISLCFVLILAVSLYCSRMKQNFKVLEEFQSKLVIFFLQIRHVALKCWTWFMRQ